MAKDRSDTAAPAAAEAVQVQPQPVQRNSPSAPQSRNARMVNSVLVGVLWMSTLSVAGCFLSSKNRQLSHIMQKIADFLRDYVGLGDFNDVRIGSFKPTEPQVIGTWLGLFWSSIVSLVVRKKYNIVYMATPVFVSLFLQYQGRFTWEEYFIVVIPFLLSVWELASD
ncbi:hypothetical protein MN608_11044 [Microdochium nivale]|nr:hypothetical protein MN608_11044 [Microdochium nivale]